MGKMERDADFRRDSKKSAKDKKYADMSIRSFQSGPIPVFCDLKSYDDIRIRQQARSQKSQEKILSERILSFKPEKIAKKTSLTSWVLFAGLRQNQEEPALLRCTEKNLSF